jgi:hypothetical protein
MNNFVFDIYRRAEQFKTFLYRFHRSRHAGAEPSRFNKNNILHIHKEILAQIGIRSKKKAAYSLAATSEASGIIYSPQFHLSPYFWECQWLFDLLASRIFVFRIMNGVLHSVMVALINEARWLASLVANELRTMRRTNPPP